MSDYVRSDIEVGDRIVVTEGAREAAHGRDAVPEIVGDRGMVLMENGQGRCLVRLDGGRTVLLFKGTDMVRR